MARKFYITLPTDYIAELQSKGKRLKSRCFMEYYFDMCSDAINSISFYKESWGLSSRGTVHHWIDEFKREIEAHHNFWLLKNASHHKSVKKIVEHQLNTNETQIEHQTYIQSTMVNDSLKSELNTNETQIEHQLNQDINSNNINNIYAESNDPADIKSSKNKNLYSDKFEVIWNLYNKKTSNKKKSFEYFNKRGFNKLDIEILKGAIEKYLSITNPNYIKDFDGFLNGLIDSYLPKKCWLVDKQDRRYNGLFFDVDNKFVTDSGKIVSIDPNNIAEYIQSGKLGFVAA